MSTRQETSRSQHIFTFHHTRSVIIAMSQCSYHDCLYRLHYIVMQCNVAAAVEDNVSLRVSDDDLSKVAVSRRQHDTEYCRPRCIETLGSISHNGELQTLLQSWQVSAVITVMNSRPIIIVDLLFKTLKCLKLVG